MIRPRRGGSCGLLPFFGSPPRTLPLRLPVLTALLAFSATIALTFSPVWADGEERARLILIKIDGVPSLVLEGAVDPDSPAVERLPYPGLFRDSHRYVRSVHQRERLLPNFEHYFFRHGTRVGNLFTGTLAVSAPSWAMIDTGHPSIIKTNSYFSRFTGRLSSYLDQFRESMDVLVRGAGKTTALWQLDLLGVPIFTDAFAAERAWSSIQILYRQRPIDQVAYLGRHIVSAGGGDGGAVGLARRHLRQLVYSVDYPEQNDRALARLTAEKVLSTESEGQPAGWEKFDVVSVIFPTMDHQFHVDSDYRNVLTWLVKMDEWIGEILAAVEQSDRREETLVAILSDHGLDFDPVRTNYTYPINRWLRDARFGSHNTLAPIVEDHVHALTAPLRGIDFNRVYESPTSPFGASVFHGERGYVTAFTANNGNPRFDAFLRNSDLNHLHLLLLEVLRHRSGSETLETIYPHFLQVFSEMRAWLKVEYYAVNSAIADLESYRDAFASKEDPVSQDSASRLDRELEEYHRVAAGLAALLDIPEDRDGWLKWASAGFRIPDLIPKRYLGPPNTLSQLQGYVSGWETLEPQRWSGGPPALKRIDYTRLFTEVESSSANAYGSRYPFSFFSVALPGGSVKDTGGRPLQQAVWLRFSEDRGEALILECTEGDLLYLPLERLVPDGADYRLVPSADKDPLAYRELGFQWLSPERWAAEAAMKESTVAVVILADLFRRNDAIHLESAHLTERLKSYPAIDRDSHLRTLRFHFDQQQPDFRVWTNRGWNVNSNSHTPGGTHGGFHELETRLIFALWGGNRFPLRRGESVGGAYLSWEVVPTLFQLLGMRESDGRVRPQPGSLPASHFPILPGRVIPLLEEHGLEPPELGGR